jgi:hypothetical protein
LAPIPRHRPGPADEHATLRCNDLRVYQTREDRRKYALFAIYMSIGLVLLLLIAVHDVYSHRC